MVPKTCHLEPKKPQRAPTWHQNGSQDLQLGPKKTTKTPNLNPKWPTRSPNLELFFKRPVDVQGQLQLKNQTLRKTNMQKSKFTNTPKMQKDQNDHMHAQRSNSKGQGAAVHRRRRLRYIFFFEIHVHTSKIWKKHIFCKFLQTLYRRRLRRCTAAP